MEDRSDIDEALPRVQAFGAGAALTARIADLETRLHGKTRDKATALLTADHIDEMALSGALTIKQLSAQIDVIIHALGILTSLPYVLKRGEVIESLSHGAGNTGRHHDLETARQIAAFKFIHWRGGPESIRQNSVFIDIFNPASATTSKRRVLYLLDKHHALHFLGETLVGRGRRADVLSPAIDLERPRGVEACWHPPVRAGVGTVRVGCAGKSGRHDECVPRHDFAAASLPRPKRDGRGACAR